MPEGCQTFGALWMMAERQCANRLDVNDFPMFGLSHFIVGLAGRTVVFLWPLKSLIEEEVKITAGFQFFSNMSAKSFNDTVRAGVIMHAVVEEGSVLWVPWGYGTASVSLATSGCLFVPYLSTLLACQCDHKEVDSVVCYTKEFLRVNANAKPWNTGIAGAFAIWLDSLSTDHGDDADADAQERTG